MPRLLARMHAVLESLLRAAGHGLGIGLLILGQAAGSAWVGILHQLACECCEAEHGAATCCSSRGVEEGARVLAEDGGCACASLAPEVPAPVGAAPDAAHGQREHVGSHLDAAPPWSAPPCSALEPAGRRDPPPPSARRADHLVGRAGRLLCGSGGERSACLGCTRS